MLVQGFRWGLNQVWGDGKGAIVGVGIVRVQKGKD